MKSKGDNLTPCLTPVFILKILENSLGSMNEVFVNATSVMFVVLRSMANSLIMLMRDSISI